MVKNRRKGAAVIAEYVSGNEVNLQMSALGEILVCACNKRGRAA
jgi:hypothetical protein